MSHLNDNLYQNVDKSISVKQYDNSVEAAQAGDGVEKKEELAEKVIAEHADIESQNKVFDLPDEPPERQPLPECGQEHLRQAVRQLGEAAQTGHGEEKKEELAEKVIAEYADIESQNKVFDRAINKILIAHRNTKLFLFLMSGPFYIILTLIKYSIKALVFYYLYRAGKGKGTNKDFYSGG
eukprot:CAMPEP_0202978984 /NCGR_PEP_ID=MMETSP1396-20130829/85260_1 /ASSEMBLY_ACC=CAM_ASM_000872 /TAXON_ID= /ORGANISM="Pseudokeronopsis sp., Strain Brazil" /LENGTH=180 /DNA_ID=CAMNT_0049718207 /DNA_START=403 /DNA_END=946 /DNA_ORIENTATION=-